MSTGHPPKNPYKGQGSLEEGWKRGFAGQRCLAYPGSNYAKVHAEGMAAALEHCRKETMNTASKPTGTGYFVHPNPHKNHMVCTPDGGLLECKHEDAAMRVCELLNSMQPKPNPALTWYDGSHSAPPFSGVFERCWGALIIFSWWDGKNWHASESESSPISEKQCLEWRWVQTIRECQQVQWSSGNVKPKLIGIYKRKRPDGSVFLSKWDGEFWLANFPGSPLPSERQDLEWTFQS